MIMEVIVMKRDAVGRSKIGIEKALKRYIGW